MMMPSPEVLRRAQDEIEAAMRELRLEGACRRSAPRGADLGPVVRLDLRGGGCVEGRVMRRETYGLVVHTEAGEVVVLHGATR